MLTYHVVPDQMLPDQIAGKTLKTVQGGTVKVTGSGDNLKVNGANVICGGVHTANATVYLIDSVLMPKMYRAGGRPGTPRHAPCLAPGGRSLPGRDWVDQRSGLDLRVGATVPFPAASARAASTADRSGYDVPMSESSNEQTGQDEQRDPGGRA